MAKNLFLGSAVLCLIFVGLSFVSDPSVFGIHDEPERIIYYGGSGFLAGLSGLVAVLSGIYLSVSRFASLSVGQRRLMLSIIALIIIAVLIAIVIRLQPIR